MPPNSISFSKIAERIKDPRNYITIMSVLCSIFVLYCLVLVWARRHDIKDGKKVCCLFVESSFQYLYLYTCIPCVYVMYFV